MVTLQRLRWSRNETPPSSSKADWRERGGASIHSHVLTHMFKHREAEGKTNIPPPSWSNDPVRKDWSSGHGPLTQHGRRKWDKEGASRTARSQQAQSRTGGGETMGPCQSTIPATVRSQLAGTAAGREGFTRNQSYHAEGEEQNTHEFWSTTWST